ncbi:hypothetical protein [Nocardia wallacei]|uniref:hypothetical protein n=1 Tax=Nocardia wallacei TaxID=480035 RepID=UPI002458E5AF|nr:hypothetical protein [Nocardia wallacei]
MRIRSIKPEFWRSDDIDALAWDQRLVFIGLWSYVDDNGVGLDKLASICADLFAGDMEREPNETLNRVSTALKVFAERGLIQRYTVADKAFLYIVGWGHQRVVNPNRPRYPRPPTSDYAESNESLNSDSLEAGESLIPVTGEQSNRGTEEKDSRGEPAPKDCYPAAFTEWWRHYPIKRGKRKALAAWQRARKRATDKELIEGAIRYANDPNRVDEYTKYPEGWLNGDHWLDPPLPPRRGRKPDAESVSADIRAAAARLASRSQERIQ